jgi:hypothetical protein
VTVGVPGPTVPGARKGLDHLIGNDAEPRAAATPERDARAPQR